MQRKIIQTNDGSSSIFVPELNENYHSTHGAWQEAIHVFLKKGLHEISKKEVSIFEVGFGTGLNAFLTYFEALKTGQKISYASIEKYPVTEEEVKLLNYTSLSDNENGGEVLDKMHAVEWNTYSPIADHFSLCKIEDDLKSYSFNTSFDIVYFDAFAPNKQENMWTETVFRKLYDAMNPDSVLVTYCAKGSVRRTMQQVGFDVKRTDGPPGKREMLQAFKR